MLEIFDTGLEIFGHIKTQNNGTVTTILGIAGDYIRIGDAATTSHSLASEDDLMVTGKLEVDGNVYVDSQNIFLSNAANVTVHIDRGATNRQAQVSFETSAVEKWSIGLADSDLYGDGSQLYIGQTLGGTTPALVIETSNNVLIPNGELHCDGGHLKLYVTDTDGDTEGDIWYDASENKLKFKTSIGVETITSA
jgi:hypothetical protein